MIDISQFGSVAGLAVLIAIIVQLFKGAVTSEKVPFFAVGVGILIALLVAQVQGGLRTPADLVSNVVGGLLAALVAVGGYEASIDKLKVREKPKLGPVKK